MADGAIVRVIRPTHYPHREGKAYTRSGFRGRVANALKRRGFTVRDTEKLQELYFGSPSVVAHQDEGGIFRNKRSYRLHALSRRLMKYDRKNRTFDLVISSGLFYVFVNERNEVLGFVSPVEFKNRGLMAPIP